MLVLAHRGSPGAPAHENTAAAVLAALDGGADGVEVDLRLTADGVLVASHDPDLARVSGCALPVAERTWGELSAAASASGVRLARVEDLLLTAAGRHVVLELKQPPPAPQAGARTALALADVLRTLHGQGVPLDVTVSSFSPALVAHVRRTRPRGPLVRTALLGRPVLSASSLLRQALAAGHDEVHPHVLPLLTDPVIVQAAHRLGVAVVPWTVNRRRDLRRLARLGVDAVITDVPPAAAEARLQVRSATA